MPYNITLIPGDGVGPEITEATVRALEATGVAIKWDVHQVGEAALKKYGTPLPEEVLYSIRKNKVALKGPVTTPIGTGFRSVNVALRQELDLYACLRPCKSYPGIKSRYENIDIVVVRENTEDLYVGIEFHPVPEDVRAVIKGYHKKMNRFDAVDGKDMAISIRSSASSIKLGHSRVSSTASIAPSISG